ncbi:response regulator [Methylobacterium sp. P31]
MVQLTCQASADHAQRADVSRYCPLANRCILVVEDEYLIALELKRWLRAAGGEVLGPVPSVDQALDLIEGCRPDAAVLDVNLGAGDNVYPVAGKLGVLRVPYLFSTGDMKLADTSAYRHRPRLEKPFREAELVRAVVKLVAPPQHTSLAAHWRAS